MPLEKPPSRLGRYKLIEHLATGGMGQVFRARAENSNTDVVIKCVHARYRTGAAGDYVRMFLDEARISTLIDHPNVVRAYEVDYRDDFYYLVMEWLQGWDLHIICNRLRAVGEKLPLPLVVRFVLEACRGLHAAHECTTDTGEPLNLIHRDIGHTNLFITREGVLKILDFGVAKSSIQLSRTQEGIIKGKVGYMSPEQCRGNPLDRRSDIFSTGIVLHELIGGARLFKRDNVLDAVQAITSGFIPPPIREEHVGADLIAVVMRALQRDPNLRYSTAAQFADTLAGVDAYDPNTTQRDVTAYLKKLFDPSKPILPPEKRAPPPLPSSKQQESREIVWAEEETKKLQPRNAPKTESLVQTVAGGGSAFDPMNADDWIPGDTRVLSPAAANVGAWADNDTRKALSPFGAATTTEQKPNETEEIPPSSFPEARGPDTTTDLDGLDPGTLANVVDQEVGKGGEDGPDETALAWLTSTRPIYDTLVERPTPFENGTSGRRVLAISLSLLLMTVIASVLILQFLDSDHGQPDQLDVVAADPTEELWPQEPSLDPIDTDQAQSTTASTIPMTNGETVGIDGSPPTPPKTNKGRTRVAKRTAKRSPKPAEKTGRLTLEAIPWANVYLGDKKLGTTPLIGVVLPVGELKLRLENQEAGLSRIVTIKIAAGGTTKKTIQLR